MINCQKLSFRDPDGHVVLYHERLLRVVHESGATNLEHFLGSSVFKSAVLSGNIVGTKTIDPETIDSTVLNLTDNSILIEHDKIFFPSFPFEWPAQMLSSAAILTLDLLEHLHEEGLTLKDASAYNILFDGPRPVFVDVLSFVKSDASSYIWPAESQFIRHFVLPLLAFSEFHLSPGMVFMTNRDGLEPESIYKMCSMIEKFTPIFLSTVTLPTILGKLHNTDLSKIYKNSKATNLNKAKFIFDLTIRRLRRKVNKCIASASAISNWSNYMDTGNSYTDQQLQEKESFVRDVISGHRPSNVLDIGCNTGHFSFIVAESGARVVAIDSDPIVIGEVWTEANRRNLNILPLVVNISRPSPAVGWLNYENESFIDRSSGRFDLVMMLAVIHHLIVSDRLPLPDVAKLMAQLTSDLLVIEFVSKDDPMFIRIARGRDILHNEFTQAYFEKTFGIYFEILRSVNVGNSFRTLYLMRRLPRA